MTALRQIGPLNQDFVDNPIDGIATTTTSPLIGLGVRLDNETLKPCCGAKIAIIGRTIGPHAAVLYCERCGRQRGSISTSTINWLTAVAKRFGAPTEITLRRRLSAPSTDPIPPVSTPVESPSLPFRGGDHPHA
jgi:hypothetical protein